MRENKKIILFFSIVVVLPLVFYWGINLYQNIAEPLPIFGPVTDQQTHTIPDFALTDQANHTYELENISNKITVANFFFTYCTTVCPLMSKNLQLIQDAFATDEQVIIVSHTVDPKRDDVERLAQYAQSYKSKKNKWFFLTGEKSKIYQLARKGYLITAQQAGEGENDFIHSEKFILIDTKKRIRGYYNGTRTEEVEQLIDDIKKLKKEI